MVLQYHNPYEPEKTLITHSWACILKSILSLADYNEPIRFFQFSKLGIFAIFSKKVVISETVRDRAKRTKILDHKGYNI